MRHGVAGNRFGRNSDLRKATVRDLSKAVLIHQRICTTMAKAKEARKLVDQLITLGKKGQLAHKRRAFAILCDHTLVKELFDKTSPRFNSRPGGYTRIIPIADKRRGDNAQLVYLELTEKDKVIVSNAKVEPVLKSKPKTDVKVVETAPAAPAHEAKADQPAKPKLSGAHDEKNIKQKVKATKSVVSGLKQIFTKKPSE